MTLGDRGLEARGDALAHHRHHRRAADEHDTREPASREAMGRHQAQADVDRAIDERRAQPLDGLARQLEIDLDLAAVDHERLRERDLRSPVAR